MAQTTYAKNTLMPSSHSNPSTVGHNGLNPFQSISVEYLLLLLEDQHITNLCSTSGDPQTPKAGIT